MKSEHRHELAENDLSKLLSKWGAEFDKHANAILTVLIVVALAAAGIIFWTRTSAATRALGWTDLANASSAEDYESVAETYAGTPVAQWATLRAADGYLREGIRLSLSDRSASNERLGQAQTAYEALLNNSSVPPEIREQVLLGYGLTLETLSDGDTSEAIAAYEKLLHEFPETRFERYATDRIEELKTGGAQEFYAWFHGIDPKPADLPGPQDGPQLPGAGDLSNLLPELGGSGIPETAPEETSDSPEDEPNPFASEEMKESSEGSQEAPASDSDKSPPAEPASEEPASEEPADETTADETKSEEPAPETPAEEPAEGDASDSAKETEASDDADPPEEPTSDDSGEGGEEPSAP